MQALLLAKLRLYGVIFRNDLYCWAKNDSLTVGWVDCKFTFDIPASSDTLGTSFLLHQF